MKKKVEKGCIHGGFLYSERMLVVDQYQYS